MPEEKNKTVFVTVGTTKFDELISTIMQEKTLNALKKKGFKNLIIQIGNGSIIPDPVSIAEKYDMTVSSFRLKPSIDQDISQADLVISHAGAGSCMQVLLAEKPLLVVVNETLADNHQTELADQLQSEKYIFSCVCKTLANTIETMDLSMLNSFLNLDQNLLCDFLDEFMGFTKKKELQK